ncbi:2-C-methyl-D-erythritol 2,4-cyclodiphosphate synthase [Roseovarius halotolerans]|uniref:Bifunctional enzyme IspD/IspF n=2 Tax=Roseovarius halotolerans TaxID=505353 RepID=A0A1X6YNU5_9RHOB|nr:2-C-methyl-D-erythritol 2,4-cyclodiphosphate synthase [Roseovarius halotolerans]
MPKQWQPLAGRRVIDWTVAAFEAVPEIDHIVVVLHPDDLDRFTPRGRVTVTTGGATRADSVRCGLEHLAADMGESGILYVLIHDVARACTKPAYITDVLYALRQPGTRAVAPALPVTDALWTGADGHVTGTRDRTGLWRAQTPQAFGFADILSAHRGHRSDAADDVEIARAAQIPVRILEGHEDNLKITHPEDFIRAEKILKDQMDIRIGQGYDVHRFGDGDHVTLCGVRIPHDRGLQGHSDADVAMHALTDAIYGGLAEGDIGRHFPPSDPQWKGAESHIFLRHAVGMASDNGFVINNMDVTLICERPKITPHAPTMVDTLAAITGLCPTRISVKATTSERLGFTGREEGIAAQAAVTLVKT